MAKKIYFGSVVGLLVALAFSFAHIKPVVAQTTCVAPQEPEVQYTVYNYGIFSTTSHVVTFYEYPASVCAAYPGATEGQSSDPTNSQAEINNCESNAVQYQNALDAYQSCIQSSTNEGNNTTSSPTEDSPNGMPIDETIGQPPGGSANSNDPSTQPAPLPSNAYATIEGWQCNQGYNNVNGQCVVPPNSTVVNGVDQCDAGYIDNVYGQCVQKQTSTPSVPATPPVVSNVVSPVINTTSPTTSSVPAGTFTISQNLNVGASGQNVTSLQNFLIAKGFLTMPAGTNEGYFGGLTKRALISFQQSVGLPDTGYCGPMTRGVINTGN